MTPVAWTTSRTRLLAVAATKRLPWLATPTPPGCISRPQRLVRAVAGGAGAGDGDNGAGRMHPLADGVVAGVRDEHVAAAVHGHAGRIRQLGRGGGATVAAVAGGAGAGHGRDGGRRRHHLAD